MCGHSAVIWLNGVSGAYLLGRVTPVNGLHHDTDREIEKLKHTRPVIYPAFIAARGDELLALKLAVLGLAKSNDAMADRLVVNHTHHAEQQSKRQ